MARKLTNFCNLPKPYVSIFCKKLNFSLFLLDCKRSTFNFLLFSSILFISIFFYFYINTFVLTFILGIFHLEVVKNAKIKKRFFSTNLRQICNKNDPWMQLHSVFHKTVNRNKLKVWKLQSDSLCSFSAIEMNVTGTGEGNLILSIIFVCTNKFPI